MEKFITRNLAVTEVEYCDAYFIDGTLQVSELRRDTFIGTRYSNEKIKKMLVESGVASQPVIQNVVKTSARYSMPLLDFIEQAHKETIEH